ncbi:MAG: rhodanese-like domain-containing protein [Bdellovibrio sp.]|nr:rhodanese-like domain-containing protein [Bdellovibrio sp.]
MPKQNCLLALVLFFTVSSAWAKEVLLDVRTPEEYAQKHLPGSVNIDVQNEDFRERISKFNREDHYEVYCKGGKRATQAVTIMKEMNFKHLTNLGGYEEAQKALEGRTGEKNGN